MIHALWAVPLALLAFSWFIFTRYYRAQLRRDTEAARRLEEGRRALAEQASGLNIFVDLLADLQEFITERAGANSKAEVYRRVLDAACLIMKCPAGSVMITSKDGEELEVICSKGLPQELVDSIKLKRGQGVAGRAIETGKMIVVDDIETDARFVGRKDVEAHLKSLVCVPLKVKEKIAGVINVDAPEAHHAFGERDLRLLQVYAGLAALSMENLDMFNNLQIFYQEMVQTLAETLDYKQFDARNQPATDHLRTRRLARAVSEALRLPESIVKYVEYASLMHGIGKMGIGEAILRKPGKLTPEEYEQIKRHPEIAQQMISKVTFLSPVVPMILYHQERWDGSGYPAGLKGEEIPLGSRIVAVINAFDAMVSERPYRKALDENEAVAELKKGAGTQFDPKVVEAFIGVIERGRAAH
ncbi:MAG: hypothetical protein A2901_08035 [Elusimicrobia bacterium RIFCSPLOWO2_01_FULL_54_10]|nr:MAG: hypothetical protein A2901_08035 [Elusimicrobia bacterium RIFCSPLOWO2_01_FULL_54_10]